MIQSIQRIYSNKPLFLMIQVWLYLIALTFSFGSTEAGARAGLVAYLLNPSPYIKLSANSIPIITLVLLYKRGQIPAHVGKLFIGRNFFFLWFIIYSFILIPSSSNPIFSFTRMGVYMVQLLPLISIIIQSQIYFGKKALPNISLCMIKFTGLLFFLPLYSFISFPQKLSAISVHKRFIIGGGLLHPVGYTSLLLIILFGVLNFPKNVGKDLESQYKKWKVFALATILFHLFVAMSRGPLLGFFIGGCAYYSYLYLSKSGLGLEIVLLLLFGVLGLLVLLSLIASDIIPLQEILRGMMREEVKGDIGIKELTTGRTDIWLYVFQNVTPFTTFFGNGFALMDSDHRGHDQDNEMHLNGAHNSYLMTFAMSGLIGFVLVTLYFFHCILLIFKTKRHIEPSMTAYYIMILTYYAIDSLTTSNIGAKLTLNTAYIFLVFSLPVVPKKDRYSRNSVSRETSGGNQFSNTKNYDSYEEFPRGNSY